MIQKSQEEASYHVETNSESVNRVSEVDSSKEEPSRVESISIKLHPVVRPLHRPLVETGGGKLTQERLQKAWEVLLDDCEDERLARLLREPKIRLEDENAVVLTVNNGIFEHGFRKYQTQVMGELRERLGCKDIVCRVQVEAEEHVAKIFSARDKFEAMRQANKNMDLMRKLFGDIDI